MLEDGELTELKVEEEKVLKNQYRDTDKVQYKGHVDSKGDMTGWGSYVEPYNVFPHCDKIVHTGTFLDGRKEGIFVEKHHDLGQDSQVVLVYIREYRKGYENL